MPWQIHDSSHQENIHEILILTTNQAKTAPPCSLPSFCRQIVSVEFHTSYREIREKLNTNNRFNWHILSYICIKWLELVKLDYKQRGGGLYCRAGGAPVSCLFKCGDSRSPPCIYIPCKCEMSAPATRHQSVCWQITNLCSAVENYLDCSSALST